MVPALPIGGYTVELGRLGYRGVELSDVVIRLGRTTTIGTITLVASPVALAPIGTGFGRTVVRPSRSRGAADSTCTVNRGPSSVVPPRPTASMR